MTQADSAPRFPYVRIRVQIGSPQHIDQVLDVEAMVDTGFDGGLALPADLIDHVIAPDTHLPWQLADGSEILTPTYVGSVTIEPHQPVVTAIIALGEEPLLGRDVTDHFRLIFDHGRQIIVEP
jgi:predicted aspartyl protease